MRKYLLPGGGLLDPTAMAQQRIAQLEAKLLECRAYAKTLEQDLLNGQKEWMKAANSVHAEMRQERDALKAELAECKAKLQKSALDYLSLDGQAWELMEERDALAIQLKQARDCLERIQEDGAKDEPLSSVMASDCLVSLDSTADEVIKRHDAEVLEKAAKVR